MPKKINILIILFLPETIGSLIYKKNFYNLKNLLFGFNCVCVGDDRQYSILEPKKLIQTLIILLKTLNKLNIKFKQFSWLKRGSDEGLFPHLLLT